MKVIFTVGTYYPLTDGVQAVTEYLAEGLVNKGAEVIVVTPIRHGYLDDEIHRGVKIVRYNINTIHAIHTGDIKGYRKLIMNLCEDADALINVGTQFVTTDSLLPILSNIKCRKILYMHGMHTFEWSRYDIESFSLIAHKVWNDIICWNLYHKHKKEFNLYDKIIQIHRFDGAYEFMYKLCGKESQIIENAADDVFLEDKTSQRVRRNYILNVSNFIPIKNQIMALEAYYRCDTDLSLIFIGSQKTGYYYELKNKIEELNGRYGKRDVVVYVGMPREEIVRYIQCAKLYIMTSRREVFPISILEAMASGTPFISTNVGVIKYMPGGVVVDNLSDIIYWIDFFSHNEEIRSNMGIIAKSYAIKNYSIGSKVDKLYDIITSEI